MGPSGASVSMPFLSPSTFSVPAGSRLYTWRQGGTWTVVHRFRTTSTHYSRSRGSCRTGKSRSRRVLSRTVVPACHSFSLTEGRPVFYHTARFDSFVCELQKQHIGCTSSVGLLQVGSVPPQEPQTIGPLEPLRKPNHEAQTIVEITGPGIGDDTRGQRDVLSSIVRQDSTPLSANSRSNISAVLPQQGVSKLASVPP